MTLGINSYGGSRLPDTALCSFSNQTGSSYKKLHDVIPRNYKGIETLETDEKQLIMYDIILIWASVSLKSNKPSSLVIHSPENYRSNGLAESYKRLKFE